MCGPRELRDEGVDGGAVVRRRAGEHVEGGTRAEAHTSEEDELRHQAVGR